MSTFTELQDETLDMCQELLGFTDFNRGKVKYYVNRGIQEFVRRTRCLQKNTDITSVANQESYTLSDSDKIYMIEHVRYVEDATNQFGDPLKPYPGGFAALPKEKSFGHPIYYWFRFIQTAATAEIGTFPIAAVSSDTIQVFHSYFPDDMTSGASEPEIRQAFHNAISQYATWRLFEVYAHTNRSYREKAIIHRQNFMDLISEYLGTAAAGTDDQDRQVIDVYNGGGW